MKSLLAGMVAGAILAVTASAIIGMLRGHPRAPPPILHDTVRPAGN